MTELDRPSGAWRFAAGLLLHLALPAYVVTVGGALLVVTAPLSLARSLHLALVVGAWFVPGYAAVVAAVTLAARAAARRAANRRVAVATCDPAIAARDSTQHVAAALATLDRLGTGFDDAARLRAAVAALRGGTWRHDDKRFQSLATDLAMAAKAIAASFDAAFDEQKSEMRLLATTTFEQIAGELRRLEGESNRLDHGDARVAARYIELRYGGTDFTGDSPD